MQLIILIMISVLMSFGCSGGTDSGGGTDTTTRWSGTKLLGTEEHESGTSITTDSSGNVYVTGGTKGNLDNQTNAEKGYSDIFVTKYNSSGVKQWTQLLGTESDDYANGIATDSSGNVYVTGFTTGNLDNQAYEDAHDIFVVKYNSSGVKQWTRLLGTESDDWGLSIATDSSGNVYITGYTQGNLDGQENKCKPDERDAFIIKYNSSGDKQWTKLLGTSIDATGRGIATDSSGNVYVTGLNIGDLDDQNRNGIGDIFVTKYNTSGVKQWTRLLGGDRYQVGTGIVTDSSGNVYVTGITNGDLDNQTNANKGNYDIVVTKYNSSGVKQWTRLLGTDSDDWGLGIATDSSGNVYTTGYTQGSLDNQTYKGDLDIFVVKYSSSGDKQWTRLLGTESDDYAKGIATDSSGNVYVTGYTEGNLDNQTYKGERDIFVVKYNSAGIKQ